MYYPRNVIVIKSEECVRKPLSLIASLGMLSCACSWFFCMKKKKKSQGLNVIFSCH